MSDVKKILMVTQCYPPTIGGIETLMQGLTDALSYAGHLCCVFADGKEASTRQVTYFAGPKPLRNRKKQKAVLHTLSERQYDAIFCDTWKSLGVLPVQADIPVICLAHGAELSHDFAPVKKEKIVEAFKKATYVVANSTFTVRQAAYYCPRYKIRLITPGIQYLCKPDKVFDTGTQKPVITTLCRLEPRKGVDKLIAAMPDVLGKYTNAQLIIAGDGTDRKRLTDLAKNLPNNIVFLGGVTEAEKSALLHQTDVFAMPVRQEKTSIEGFGLVYLEAGLCGVPSLAGKAGGASNAVIDGKTGYLCDGSNQLDVTQKLLALLAVDKSYWQKSLEIFTQQSLWSKKINAYLDLLAQ